MIVGRYGFLAALFNGCRELRVCSAALGFGRKYRCGMYENRVQEYRGIEVLPRLSEVPSFSSLLIKNTNNLLVFTSAQRVVRSTERSYY